MKSRILYALIGIVFGLTQICSPAAVRRGEKPNIILIVADDLGYADLGCQGAKDVATPNIDALSKNGIRFANAYVSCPVCSPTRAGLLTGRYQQRFGHEFNPGRPEMASAEFGLPLSEVTLADHLKRAGYATGMVGKWHLGLNEKFHPMRRGFDEYFGFLHGSHSYVDAKADARNPILRGTEPIDEKEYLTQAFTREALAYIERHQKEPFFLCLTYNAAHAPMQAPELYKARFSNIADEKRRTFAAMLAALDDGVGAVLKKLRETELEETTVIFFISDNGGPTRVTSSRNDPLSGVKGQVREGGIRVPFMVQWKARLPRGKVYEHPVIALDIVPTALAAAGAASRQSKQIDGVNLLPYLTGRNRKPPHDYLFWRYGEQSAVRQGKWKLARLQPGPFQLFDLESDISETKDLAGQNPDLAKDLEAAYQDWNAQLAQPLWGQRGGRRPPR